MTEPSPEIGSIQRYNPFDLHRGVSQLWRLWIQQTIFYGESRLRKAIIGIRGQDKDKQLYLQQFLRRELLFFMTYVGLAASASIYLDIPVVLRSLAVSLGHLAEDELPLTFDLDFIALLEAGTRPTDPFRVVNSYKQPWWKGTSVSRKMGTINEDTLEDALSYHRSVLNQLIDGDGDPRVLDIPALQLFNPIPGDHADVLFEAIQRTHSLVNGLYTSAQAERELTTRRAAAFLMLHEASISIDATDAIDKEKPRDPAKTKTISVDTKWTTGNPLTLSQVLQILEGRKRSQHEGYIHDMPQGRLTGVFSDYDTDTQTLSESIYTAESHSVNDPPPETDLQFPKYFDQDRFRLRKVEWPLSELSSTSKPPDTRSPSEELPQAMKDMDVDMPLALEDPSTPEQNRPLASDFAAIEADQPLNLKKVASEHTVAAGGHCRPLAAEFMFLDRPTLQTKPSRPSAADFLSLIPGLQISTLSSAESTQTQHPLAADFLEMQNHQHRSSNEDSMSIATPTAPRPFASDFIAMQSYSSPVSPAGRASSIPLNVPDAPTPEKKGSSFDMSGLPPVRRPLAGDFLSLGDTGPHNFLPRPSIDNSVLRDDQQPPIVADIVTLAIPSGQPSMPIVTSGEAVEEGEGEDDNTDDDDDEYSDEDDYSDEDGDGDDEDDADEDDADEDDADENDADEDEDTSGSGTDAQVQPPIRRIIPLEIPDVSRSMGIEMFQEYDSSE